MTYVCITKHISKVIAGFQMILPSRDVRVKREESSWALNGVESVATLSISTSRYTGCTCEPERGDVVTRELLRQGKQVSLSLVVTKLNLRYTIMQ